MQAELVQEAAVGYTLCSLRLDYTHWSALLVAYAAAAAVRPNKYVLSVLN